MTETSNAVSNVVRDSIVRILRLVSELEIEHSWALVNPGDAFAMDFHRVADRSLGSLPDVLDLRDDEQALRWAMQFNHDLRKHLLSYENATEDAKNDFPRSAIVKSLERDDQEMALLLDSENIRRIMSRAEATAKRIQESASKAEQSASAAQQAAGITGEVVLSEHFADYANSELRSANVFRWLAIVGIVAALGVAAFARHPAADDWVALTYRVAQLGGIAALATYFGRQAAQHRRVHNWAKSLQVQLQSFPAFIAPVDEVATRDEIYSAFARRVLGAPPEKPASSSDEVYPTQQLVELAAAIAKKSQ